MTPPADAMTTPWGPIWLSNDGIIMNIGAKASQHKEDVAGYLACLKEVGAGKRRPYLVEISRIRSMSKEVRDEYDKQHIEDLVTALALVTDSAIAKMMGNILVGINSGKIPTKLFTDPVKARAWLLQYRIN